MLDTAEPILPLPDVAALLRIPVTKVHQQLRDGHLVALRRNGVPMIPQVFFTAGGEVVSAGQFVAPANENWQVDHLRTFASDHRLYLVEWSAGGEAFGNHYLAGQPPFSLEQYRAWLAEIAALPRAFDADTVAL